MVWTNPQTTAFFTDANQMAIPAATLPGLTNEGIDMVDDLEDFDDDDLKQVMSNLRRPGGTIPDPTDVAGVRRIPTPAYVFGAKSYKRLKIAASAVRYYTAVGRETTSVNMHYENVLKDFGQQWDSLLAKKDDDEPSIPKITRALPIVKWTEHFEDYLHEIVGHRNIPLAYLIREEVVPANPPPPLATRRAYSNEHGSVVNELIARASHTHNRYGDDNQKLYSLLEEATRTTTYASSIRPYARRKDGRGAYLALKAQYAGRDKWQKEINNQETFIHTRVWKGNTNFSLEGFITQHRASHVSLVRCSQHIPHQLPNERTRVTHLLNAIQTSDASLQAAIAHIKSTKADPMGLMSDFERTAAYLIQFDPVSKKRKRAGNSHNINAITFADDEASDEEIEVKSVKSGGGSKTKVNKCPETGVEFRYYKPEEYRKLNKEQKDKLREHREKNGKDDPPKKKGNKRQKRNETRRLKKQVISVLKSLTEEEEDAEKEEDELREYIVSVVKGINDKKSDDTKSEKKPSSTLRAITKRLKRDKKD